MIKWHVKLRDVKLQIFIVTVPGRNTPRKKTKPVIFLLPKLSSIPYDIENISKKIKSILEDLKIAYKVLNKRGNNLSLDICAVENTWSNQRRKRRLMKRLQDDNAKKPKIVGIDNVDGCVFADTCNSGEQLNNEKKTAHTDIVDTQKSVESTTKSSISEINSEECKKEDVDKSIQPKALISTDSGSNMSIESHIVVHAFLKLFKKENAIFLEMEALDGTAGKEGLYQIVQYIKNNWK